jgi:MiaB/RimO family radical SAM methylthiotransferase
LIEHAKAQKADDARIMVCGCLPDINIERLRAIHNDIAFGPKDPAEFSKFLSINPPDPAEISSPISYYQYSRLKKAIYHSKRFVEIFPLIDQLPIVRRLLSPLFIYDKDVLCLRVETGCWGNCTYCAIRFAKGKTKSKPFDEIVADFEMAIRRGYSKFVLVGDEITSYGSDLNGSLNILDLIGRFAADERISTLFLESFEPSFMISNFDRLIRILSCGKIPVFCGSVQSGSNRILSLMKRQYSAEDFIYCIKEIKKQLPWIYLRSEIIVGFPGETEDEFMESLDLISRLNFDFIDVYEYEDRPHTVASRMPDKIPTDKKRIRRKRLMRQHWKNLIFKKH